MLSVEDARMNPVRLVFAIVASVFLLCPTILPAEDGAPPFAMDKQYSADLTITTKAGMSIPTKTYVDGDKMRSDMTMSGVELEFIVRMDQKKIYQVIAAMKATMVMPYNPDKLKGTTTASFGPEGKFDLIGPDTVDGVACTKYKVTSDKDKQVCYFWVDVAHKLPVQMAAADASLTAKWKNYKVGPQDAALFEPPTGYQVMPMPSLPGMPGGTGGGL